MTQVRVISKFFDVDDRTVLHMPGEVISVDEKRAANIVAKGLGVYVVAPEPDTPGAVAPPVTEAVEKGCILLEKGKKARAAKEASASADTSDDGSNTSK